MPKPKKSQQPVPRGGEIVLYQAEDGGTRIQCRFDNETIWLTQVEIAGLFQTSVPNINLHLKAIYADGELTEAATVKSYLIVRSEGSRQVSREVLHYRLEAILAVGFRVRSQRGTQFRQWAITRLEEYLRKGDVTIAKNYLREDEIAGLNLIVVMFLDYAEDQARRRKQVFLKDWKEKLDQFLQFNERNVLSGMGRISREQADELAHEHYARFEQRRRTAAELEAEDDAVKQLTETAKKLPISQAPTGRPHTSPGQRPGSNGPKESKALKGRDKGGQV